MRKKLKRTMIRVSLIVLALGQTALAKTTTKKTKEEEPVAAVSEYLYAEGTKASSTLSGGTYDVYNMFDGDYATAWVEGAKDNGEGEYISLTFEKGTVITDVTICPGYYKSRKLFYANSAPTAVSVSGGGEEYSFDISGCAFAMDMVSETLVMPEPLVLEDGVLKITIDSVREGTSYTDTCISELSVYGLYANSEAAKALSEGKKVTVLSESAARHLVSEAMYFAERQAEDYQDLTGLYTMKKADVDTKAFLVYWYLYNVTDNRATSTEDQIYHVVDDPDVTDIYEELTGEELDEEAYQTLLNEYVAELNDDGMYFEASGDFGGGYRYADPHIQLSVKRGKLIIEGDYCTYSNEEQNYVPTNSYTLYLAEGGPYTLGGYRIEKIVIK